MGSQSDYKVMKLATKILKNIGVKFETKIISAHRTPKRMYDFANSATKNNIGVIIAGAGGSAHLPGMIASLTSIPVLGVPIEGKKLKGLDSLLSIVQMPKGIPVGTLAIGENGAANAALLAASAPAIPSIEPLPNSFLFFDHLLASEYPIIDATVAPSAGRTPMNVPMPHDLKIVFQIFL